ncbi:hypothetical protein [Brevundimonas sp. Root1423]|uniref:hypothetical protein n=1 Tax=Brevundimonas sp. Root1423 TaxID=1736462 RepID=UPI0006FDFCAD|nr:hypothetical protein [Brevundimonas sp. Root1423]KQY75083.1 hypothetical protein ASD25_10840 [Brevundimonas sp. Root1423]
MKRAMFGKAGLAAFLASLAAACAPPAPPEAPAGVESAASGWSRPPEIQAVQRASSSLIFTGAAEPGARVVLRSDSGAAYAAAADERGRFEIRMTAPAGDLWLRPETQIGQDSAPSPDRLLIVAGGQGPIAILRSGGPTRRLDRAPALGAVDSDSRMRLASGRAAGRAPVLVQAAGEAVRVTPDAQGRWSLMLRSADGPGEIQAGGARFDWPGDASRGPAPRVERAGQGWRVAWTGADGARQSTWLPDAA